MARTIHTETVIDAPAERVWQVLTDYPQQSSWNSFLQIEHAPGKLRVGETIRARFSLPGQRPNVFTPKVLEYEDNAKLRWRGQLWGMDTFFVGEHFFTVKPQAGGKTLLEHGESFRGLLVPLLGSMLATTEQEFKKFNEGLKRKAEERAL